MTLKTTVLYGEYELTIDPKNRLLIPADVRRSLDPDHDGEAFFVVIGVNHKPWLYPERRYQEMVSKLESVMTPEEDRLAFDQINFSMANKVEWDKQGRWLVPETARKRTQLSREITMIGVRDHLELWNRSDWEARREFLFSRSAELAAKQRASEAKPV